MESEDEGRSRKEEWIWDGDVGLRGNGREMDGEDGGEGALDITSSSLSCVIIPTERHS